MWTINEIEGKELGPIRMLQRKGGQSLEGGTNDIELIAFEIEGDARIVRGEQYLLQGGQESIPVEVLEVGLKPGERYSQQGRGEEITIEIPPSVSNAVIVARVSA